MPDETQHEKSTPIHHGQLVRICDGLALEWGTIRCIQEKADGRFDIAYENAAGRFTIMISGGTAAADQVRELLDRLPKA